MVFCQLSLSFVYEFTMLFAEQNMGVAVCKNFLISFWIPCVSYKFPILTFLFAKFGEELPNCPKATSIAITQHLLEGSFGYLSYLLFWSPILFRLHV